MTGVKYVQVCGARRFVYRDIYLHNVSDEKATCYGVYIGAPGGYEWVKDFKEKDKALQYAKSLVADDPSLTLRDDTYKE